MFKIKKFIEKCSLKYIPFKRTSFSKIIKSTRESSSLELINDFVTLLIPDQKKLSKQEKRTKVNK